MIVGVRLGVVMVVGVRMHVGKAVSMRMGVSMLVGAVIVRMRMVLMIVPMGAGVSRPLGEGL
jgi:hypothetical protein